MFRSLALIYLCDYCVVDMLVDRAINGTKTEHPISIESSRFTECGGTNFEYVAKYRGNRRIKRKHVAEITDFATPIEGIISNGIIGYMLTAVVVKFLVFCGFCYLLADCAVDFWLDIPFYAPIIAGGGFLCLVILALVILFLAFGLRMVIIAGRISGAVKKIGILSDQEINRRIEEENRKRQMGGTGGMGNNNVNHPNMYQQPQMGGMGNKSIPNNVNHQNQNMYQQPQIQPIIHQTQEYGGGFGAPVPQFQQVQEIGGFSGIGVEDGAGDVKEYSGTEKSPLL